MKKTLMALITMYCSCCALHAQNWLLTGNAGTNPSTNFVGTKDAKALALRTNNQPSGFIDFAAAKANTAFGYQALKNLTGNNNAAFGYKALSLNTTGAYNSAYGAYALSNNTTGYSNVAIGIGSLYKNQTKNNQVAIGDSSLYNSTTGFFNTAIGSKALYTTTSGSNNVAIGLHALYANTTGIQNTVAGTFCLTSNTTGSYNSAFGYEALFLNETGNNNTATGFQALYYNKASFNTANGYRALYVNSSGSFNTSGGTFSMYNNTSGGSNAAYGYSALNGNTTGSYNTAIGPLALFSGNGSYNTSVGYRTLYSNQTGEGNDAHGNEALYNNTTGSYNVAVGDEALLNNTYGQGNTAVGVNALTPNVGSFYNTAVGYLALAYAGTPGYNNVAVGAFSGPDVNSDGLYNTVAIGEQCYTTASNQARIGNSSTTSIGGYANWSNISDERVKQNIKQNVPGLAFIKKLQPVTYNLSMDAISKFIASVKKDKKGNVIPLSATEINAKKAKEQIVYTGFLAQQVEKAAKDLNYNFSGIDAPKNDKDLYGLRYAEFVVPLVKAVQELSDKNDELEQRIKKLEDMLTAQSSSPANATQTISLTTASLQQNIPNPFNNATTIRYTLPQQFNAAKIVVMSNGKLLKEINVSGKGEGSINVDAAQLAAGTYTYTLYVDGKLAGSRQMVVLK